MAKVRILEGAENIQMARGLYGNLPAGLVSTRHSREAPALDQIEVRQLGATSLSNGTAELQGDLPGPNDLEGLQGVAFIPAQDGPHASELSL